MASNFPRTNEQKPEVNTVQNEQKPEVNTVQNEQKQEEEEMSADHRFLS
ncbi:hypothetical protein PROFUN_00519 [Planoprotostelium fungivorum]|uniref:Uncharacterized protein n=1 Tax=Planoprotostelium fungivorum TaxID=1890364 RepID=A0A2P6N120_9EUKA|nr:hypothetical protein PROFUN_00519 [Planoprotostelium fungivorum]